MKLAQARHNELLRAAIETNDGYIFEVVGDAVCAAFHTAECAIQAAARAQLDLRAESWGEAVIRVRMGIHTGTAHLQENGLYSGYTTLSHVQRLASAGHGGQCLLSSTVEPLVLDKLPASVMLRDLGERRLKDVPHPERIFQLIIEDLPADFPPLRTLDASPNNLPIQLTSFIGRKKELGDVRRLLPHARLLTFTGPGGTGKSRLAIQTALNLLETFPHGAWLVELAPVSDPSQVASTTLTALNLPAEVHRPAIDMLCDYLHEREVLLILDNCEHLLESCAVLVDRLLHAAPRLHILTTSREALGVAGEVTYRVPSLGLPDPEHLPALQSLSQYEAVRLFIERARLAQTDFSVNNENAPAVAQICQRLDGIPLAIELAAAKVHALSPEQIAKRLDDRFRLLTGGSRTALERYQTLRAALDWSYNLLSPTEQIVFQRVSVFGNGWTLEAAESICAGEHIENEEVFSLLEALVNKSLVSSQPGKSEVRYKMLETMRQYAVEKLPETRQGEVLRDRHLQYFLGLAETAAPHLLRSEQVEWLSRLEADHGNLRLALEWSLGRERPESALRMCIALSTFWNAHCHWKEGARWLERALAKPIENPAPAEKALRGRAFYQDAFLAQTLDNFERMDSSAAASLDLCQQTGNRLDAALATVSLNLSSMYAGGWTTISRWEQILSEFRELKEPYWEARILLWASKEQTEQGRRTWGEHVQLCEAPARKVGERMLLADVLLDKVLASLQAVQFEKARQCLAEIAELYDQIGFMAAKLLLYHGFVAHMCNEREAAKSAFLKSVEQWNLLGENHLRSWCLQYLAFLARDEGNLPAAQDYLEESLQIARQVGWTFSIALRLTMLGNINLLQGRLESAKQNFREGLAVARADQNPDANPAPLVLVAGFFAGRFPGTATKILAAVSSFDRERFDPRLGPIIGPDFRGALDKARDKLEEADFNEAWKEGAKLSPVQAIELALQTL
jgi:predicted ATPase